LKIKVLPSQVEFENDSNLTLLQQCQRQNIQINSICKGQPKCAECRIRIVEGDQNVMSPTSQELALLGSNYYLDGRRLSCQVYAFGDITVDITEQIERQQNAHKKVRGFRSATKVHQSHAVLDTLMLDKKEEEPVPQPTRNATADGPKNGGDRGSGKGRSGSRSGRRR